MRCSGHPGFVLVGQDYSVGVCFVGGDCNLVGSSFVFPLGCRISSSRSCYLEKGFIFGYLREKGLSAPFKKTLDFLRTDRCILGRCYKISEE